MKEGFYYYRGNIYYGCYDEKQVSGGGMIKRIKQERIKTNHSIREEDCYVNFWDNHCLLEPEYEDLKSMLLKMGQFMKLNKEQELDFSVMEAKLGIALPKELKLIYTAIHNRKEFFESTEHFLSFDEIYVEQGIVVFFKKKRTPIAGYDMESGRLARYYKKEWSIEKGDICCYQFCVGRMMTIALESKPVVKKGRCKGKFVSTLNIERELESFCNEKYHLLSELNIYGIAVMYSEDGLIAWIRSNGFYADIHAGAEEELYLDELGAHLGEMIWK